MAEETAPAESPAPEAATADSTTFTQAQVNDLIAREKGKIQSKYGDYNELKSKADKLAEIEAASATDLEKVQKKADDCSSNSWWDVVSQSCKLEDAK